MEAFRLWALAEAFPIESRISLTLCCKRWKFRPLNVLQSSGNKSCPILMIVFFPGKVSLILKLKSMMNPEKENIDWEIRFDIFYSNVGSILNKSTVHSGPKSRGRRTLVIFFFLRAKYLHKMQLLSLNSNYLYISWFFKIHHFLVEIQFIYYNRYLDGDLVIP